MERTLVLVKPDGVQRGLVGQVISRLERRGLKLCAMKLMQVDDSLARKHYAEHSSRPFFANLVMFLSSSPVVAMVWEAAAAIEVVRNAMGPTNPAESPMGTIRGDMALDIGRNLVHGSDSVESAAREVALFFSPNEILDYDRTTDIWTKEA